MSRRGRVGRLVSADVEQLRSKQRRLTVVCGFSVELMLRTTLLYSVCLEALLLDVHASMPSIVFGNELGIVTPSVDEAGIVVTLTLCREFQATGYSIFHGYCILILNE